MLLEPGKASVALAGSWGRTRMTSFLMQRNEVFRKLPGLLVRALHRAAAVEAPAARRSVATLQLQSRPLGRAAGLRALLSTLRATARSLNGRRLGKQLAWTLMLRHGAAMLDPDAPVVGPHARLKSPKGWWADPYLVQADGRTLLFVEEMADPKSHKANIVCVELVDGGARRLGIALDEPGHLSFPQPFLWEGQWYMTLETSYDRRVSLYRATDFPLQWVRVRDLITGRVCVDPTLHHFDGHWYLFTNVAESGNNTCDELFLFVADSLEGPYKPHPVAPIVSDVRRARLAGRLFHHEGRLIRPSQDCAPGYGKAVVFNEVLELGRRYIANAHSRGLPRIGDPRSTGATPTTATVASKSWTPMGAPRLTRCACRFSMAPTPAFLPQASMLLATPVRRSPHRHPATARPPGNKRASAPTTCAIRRRMCW